MEISIALTSCGRWDLLRETLMSLNVHWDGPDCDLHLYEDRDLSKPELVHLETIIETFAPRFRHRIQSGKVGQIIAIDRLYSAIDTPLIFHLEDDWTFFKSGFYAASKSVIDEVPNCSMVWIRNQNDRNGHPAVGSIRRTKDRVQYQRISDSHGGGMWAGFSFNPGLRRKADYDRIFPNGYGSVAEFNPKTPWAAESAVGKTYKRAGMSAFTLLSGYVKHSGDGRHIQ